MKVLIALVTTATAGYGFADSGFFGALTGLVAALGIGSGFQMFATGTMGNEPLEQPLPMSQRFGGLLTAIAGAIGAYYGGWRMGWLYALGGYLVGMAATLVLSLPAILRARR